MDALIRRDPAHRGLVAREQEFGPLCSGHLAGAAAELAANAGQVAIVTGFFVPDSDPPAAETDGPPGAVVLAMAFRELGIGAVIVTDPLCREAVRAAAGPSHDSSNVVICSADKANWANEFFQTNRGKSLTHLIAIERVGPSHDEESFRNRTRASAASSAQFRVRVPVEHRGRCHNMRGEIIDEWSAPLHQLFETGPRVLPHLKTIGIGDGGNEIGMGTIPWEALARRLAEPYAGFTICRTATDWNILAGTSNWGGFALAAALLMLRRRTDALEQMDEDFHRAMLEQMIAKGPAVDGITRRREATVDGLPFCTYIQTWLALRQIALRRRDVA